MNTKSKPIHLELDNHEALVLFEFLSRFQEKEELNIEDAAEEQALWNLLALLEQQLTEPFKQDYPTLLENARSKLCPGK